MTLKLISALGLAAMIEQAFLRILGRAPEARELEQCRSFLAGSPLAELCRALFNLNDFLYPK